MRTLDKNGSIIKRVIDLCLAFGGGILVTPFMLLVSAIIWLDDPRGRILYGHTRVGKGGRRFKMWKFRTMVADAEALMTAYLAADPCLEEEWEHYQKLREDPRVTPAGRWLRKYSLDELPQLWNVLKGEMSMVGPRPFLPEQQALYGQSYQTYIRITPGITGLWQTSGRNQASFEERASLDEDYANNWSIWLDLRILARTLPVLIKRVGAY